MSHPSLSSFFKAILLALCITCRDVAALLDHLPGEGVLTANQSYPNRIQSSHDTIKPLRGIFITDLDLISD